MAKKFGDWGNVVMNGNPRSPAVVCIETGQVFNYGIDAAKNFGQTSASHIYKCCRKEVETAFGFHWEYYFPQEDLTRADNG